MPYNSNDLSNAIMSIPSGGGSASEVEYGVNFIDYDGSIIASWESDSVAMKSELPNNPTRTGLTSQGWNWTLTDIKSYISSCPKATIFVGQIYATTSGLTEIDITVTKVTGLTVTCNMVGNKNWGDGVSDNLKSHTYTDYGNYTITCDGTEIPAGTANSGGMFGSSNANVNRFWCTGIRIGNSVTSIGTYAFNNCHSLARILFSNRITSINANAFNNCYSIENVILPNSITEVVNSAFPNCFSLANVSLSNSVTSIGSTAFYNCYSLKSITFPGGTSSIGGTAFYNCYSITKYIFATNTSVTSLQGANAFTGINGICKIIVADDLYDSWKTALNWTGYSNYIYKASEA